MLLPPTVHQYLTTHLHLQIQSSRQRWQWLTYQEVEQRSLALAAGLLAQLEVGDGLRILFILSLEFSLCRSLIFFRAAQEPGLPSAGPPVLNGFSVTLHVFSLV